MQSDIISFHSHTLGILPASGVNLSGMETKVLFKALMKTVTASSHNFMAKSQSAAFFEALHHQLQVVPQVPQALLSYVSSLDPCFSASLDPSSFSCLHHSSFASLDPSSFASPDPSSFASLDPSSFASPWFHPAVFSKAFGFVLTGFVFRFGFSSLVALLLFAALSSERPLHLFLISFCPFLFGAGFSS